MTPQAGSSPDYELTDQTKTQRRLSELQGIDPMIPYMLMPKPGLVVYSVYSNPGGARPWNTSSA
jgi:hypothetical protein